MEFFIVYLFIGAVYEIFVLGRIRDRFYLCDQEKPLRISIIVAGVLVVFLWPLILGLAAISNLIVWMRSPVGGEGRKYIH